MNLLTIWDSVSLVGIHYDLPEHVNRKIILGNRISALAGLLVFILSFLYLDFVPQFLTNLLGSILCFLFILFNYLGKVKFSRIFFTLSVPIFLVIGSSFAPESVKPGLKLAMLSEITVPLVLFGITEKKWMIIGIIYTVACFGIFDFVHFGADVSPDRDYPMHDPLVAQYLGGLISFSVFIATYIYFQKLNLEAENKLKELLHCSNRQRDEIAKQKKQLEIHNRELNIRALSAQMNPHFLYNSLNSIQHFLTVNDKTSSLIYLSKFGKLIRQFIDYSDKGMIPLADELKLLNYYLELESLRFASMFRYKLEVENDLLLYNINVPLLLIQTHVENAILHGLLHKEEGDRQLNIFFSQEGEVMRCVIEDNGIGRKGSQRINRNKSTYHHSRGIDLSSQRLTLMYEDKGYENLIDIIDLYNGNHSIGTRVELRIPFESI